jgi:hypothetical protein
MLSFRKQKAVGKKQKAASPGWRPHRLRLSVFAYAFCYCLLAAGCRRDMQDQPKSIAYRENRFYKDGTARGHWLRAPYHAVTCAKIGRSISEISLSAKPKQRANRPQTRRIRVVLLRQQEPQPARRTALHRVRFIPMTSRLFRLQSPKRI